MKNTTLLIMAAGIGSRFGGGIKQLEPVGLHNEIIMDYSIHDAMKQASTRLFLIIRKDIEDDFRERIGNRIEEICENRGVEVLTHSGINDIPGYFSRRTNQTVGNRTGCPCCKGANRFSICRH